MVWPWDSTQGPLMCFRLPVYFETLKQYAVKSIIKPNPHFFISITKVTAYCWKEPLLPHSLHKCTALWWGGGRGGASSTALKICLIKMRITLKLSSKAYWKWYFYWKPLKQKSLLRFLRGVFDFLKIFCFNHPGLIFIFTKKAF
jgi:hypothetical protein